MNLKKLKAAVLVSFLSINAFSQNLNVTFRSQVAYPQGCANICGYVDSLGNEYALVGACIGLSIVDVTDPDAPVQVYQHIGPTGKTAWQEVKVLGKYAYVTTEAGGGLQIFNLSSLPDTTGIVFKSWTGDGAIAGVLTSIHTLHIDTSKRFVYLHGSSLFNGGAVIADLTDPWNPVYVGHYSVGVGTAAYLHDGYVRNDTLYGGHMYGGYFSIVDCRNKANPIELATQFTPNRFTHNTWLSTNSKVLFTTDEKDGGFLTAFDISDIANISELDRIQSNPGSHSCVHNTHVIRVASNDYAVSSWYKDGFTIVDAGRPHNLVQVGNYDTYVGSGGGYIGGWGVYPFLPSGNILVTNGQEGLFVLTPDYQRACYLEGNATDSVCGGTLNKVHITVTAANINDSTDISGDYKTGTALPGTYTVTFSRAGYISKTISGIVLSRGIVTNLNVQLAPFNVIAINGLVADVTANPLAGANVHIEDSTNTYDFISDGNGEFSNCSVSSATDYNVFVGKWGYSTSCLTNQTINQTNNNLGCSLIKKYYDDFTFDFGWTVNSTASTGKWERDIPIGTMYSSKYANPGTDVNSDCSDKAFVTGNKGKGGSFDDVDNGATTLISPLFDLSTYTDPYIDYSRWFYSSGSADSLVIMLSNGTEIKTIETVVFATPNNSSWVHSSFRIQDFLMPTATMRLFVRAADTAPGSTAITEAGFDNFLISEGPTGVEEQEQNNSFIAVYPNPFTEYTTIEYKLKSKVVVNANIEIIDITGRVVDKIILTETEGSLKLKPSIDASIYFVKIINGDELIEPIKILKLK